MGAAGSVFNASVHVIQELEVVTKAVIGVQIYLMLCRTGSDIA